LPIRITADERAAILIGNSGGQTIDGVFWNSDAPQTGPGDSISACHDMIRASGLAGDRDMMQRALTQARNLTNRLHRDRAEFKANRGDIANLAADFLQPRLAEEELLRFLPPANPAPRVRAAAARMRAFGDEFGDIIAPAANWLAGSGDVSIVASADLGLVAQFSMLCTASGVHESDLFQTLQSTFAMARRLGQRAGLRVVAIPDFAFAMLENRPSHILSFHTAGRFPGFVHFKRADLPGYMTLDAGGYSGWSSLSGVPLSSLDLPPLATAEAVCADLWRTIVTANVSKYAQDDLSEPAEPLAGRYVFVPLQVATDRTQMVARFSLDQMLDMVMERFRGTGIAVVVKPHPKAVDMDHLARLISLAEAGDIVLRHNSIHRLIAGAQAVITVNSGVGSEALLHRKPIYCFGAADYDSVAHRIESAEQFTALTTPIRPAVSLDDLVRFTAYYRQSYLVERAVPGRLDAAIQQRVIDPILAFRS
jgi:hypothetical protein